VLGDPGLLSRALDNLVVNAIEHGGTRLEISAEPGQDEVEVEVIDSGGQSAAGWLAGACH
jgi:signal transduction histidine kinase